VGYDASPRTLRQLAVRRGCSLTYGEVLPHSVERDVFRGCLLAPLRAAAAAAAGAPELARSPCVYDLGSGTGKIPLQLALLAMEAGLPGVRGVGVELAADRHGAAVAAFARLRTVTQADVVAQLEKLGWCHGAWALRDAAAAVVVAGLRTVAPLVDAVHGDILTHPWPRDATAIFINNTVFEPALNCPLLARLAGAPVLRAVAVLRALCARHSGVCSSRGDPCCAFGAPVVATTCNPTWDQATTLFGYGKDADWVPGRPDPAARLRSPPATPRGSRLQPAAADEEPSNSPRADAEERAKALMRKRLREGGDAPAAAPGAPTARAESPPTPLKVKVGGVAVTPATPARPPPAPTPQPSHTAGRRPSRAGGASGGGGSAAPSPQAPRFPAVERVAAPAEGAAPSSPQRPSSASVAALLLTPQGLRAAPLRTPPLGRAGRGGSRDCTPAVQKGFQPPLATAAAGQ
jgi:hypothetical protein